MVDFGQRLKSARIMANLSMDELVEKIDRIVSKQSISKYEKGIMQPENSKIVIKIAKALNVPIDFFYAEKQVSLSDIQFRKNSSLSKKEIDSIIERVKDYLGRYFEIEYLLNLENSFTNCLKDAVISYDDPESIEQAASTLRKFWKIGEKESITNVVTLLENNNIKIVELEVSHGFEGLSGRVNEKPFVVLNKKAAIDRKRFTAIHELAHIILNINKEDPQSEKICHSFAGAFLISKSTLEEQLGRRNRISLQELINIKEQYGISIQAIMAREHFLGFISDYNYTQFNIYINKHNLKKNEPGKYLSKEEPTRFKQLINRAVAEGVISMSKAAALLQISLNEIEGEIKIVD